MATVPLLKLKLGMCYSTIKVRVQSMWDNVHVYTGEFQSLDFIFVDEESSTCHGTVWRYLAREFRPKFQEGKVYQITNMKLSESRRYRPVQGDLKIVLLPNTIVSEPLEVESIIPRFSFSFADYDTIVSRQENYDLFTDVIGLLTAYGPIEYSDNAGMGRRRRELELLIARNKYVRIVLWGNIAERFDDEYLASVDDYLVVVFTTTVVKLFAKKRSLSSTSGTKVYINIGIPETQRIKDNLCQTCMPGLRFLASPNGAHLPVHEQMFMNRKKIVEIKDILLSGTGGGQSVIVTCLATIKDFVPSKDWCYVSCVACKSKMEFSDGVFVCDCGNKEQNPVSRFAVKVRVADDEETTSLVLFDNEIEKLFSTSATALLRAQKNDTKAIPERLLDLIGMTFIFQIKMTDYNFNNIREDFSVIKTFKPVQSLEREHKIKMQNERMKGKTSNSPDSCLNFGSFTSPSEIKGVERSCPTVHIKEGSNSKSSVIINDEDDIVAFKRRKTKAHADVGIKLFADEETINSVGHLPKSTSKADPCQGVGLCGTMVKVTPAPISDEDRAALSSDDDNE